MYAFPLRLREDRNGALDMYRRTPGEFADDDVRLAQAFAEVTTIGILQERKPTAAEMRTRQLQLALDGRVTIEQAEGIVSAERDISLDDAFDILRRRVRQQPQVSRPGRRGHRARSRRHRRVRLEQLNLRTPRGEE